MALTPQDLEALRTLLREELTTRADFVGFRNEVRSRVAKVDDKAGDARREQECLFVREQMKRLENESAAQAKVRTSRQHLLQIPHPSATAVQLTRGRGSLPHGAVRRVWAFARR